MIDSNFVLELWEIVSPSISAKAQADIAYSIIRLLQDYDITEDALTELMDTDIRKLKDAYIDVYEIETEDSE